MKHELSVLLVALSALALSSCGSESEEPVEQIIVRQPGATTPITAASDGVGAADLVATGKAAFAACVACHSADQGGSSGVGPNLNGVFGRTAGSLDGYSFSEALVAADFAWDNEGLDAFLANPSAKVPGTAMMTGAVQDDERRAAIIAYLASLSE